MKLLKTYSWPGNVRELENVIEYLINIVGDDLPIPASALPERLLKKSSENNIANIKETEKQLIMEALQRCTTDGQSIDSVSKLLGISRATLYRKIRHYNLRQ
jgi:transcriptional regulator of acetoin/glycerol metabolism